MNGLRKKKYIGSHADSCLVPVSDDMRNLGDGAELLRGPEV